MGRLSARWRRLWGIRPGELRRPVAIIGRGRTMGEPETGPHGRGWGSRHARLGRAPIAAAKRPHAEPAAQSIEPADQTVFPLELVADDELDPQVIEHAREVVLGVAKFAPRPVLHARIVLRVLPDPALERPAIAKASLDVSGRSVRAHLAAEHMVEAIDLLERRLRRNLEDFEELARARHHETGMVPRGEWRHGSLPTARPEYFPRPPGERELIRRKSFALSPLAAEEAASEMQLLDYDFHLFTNAATGDEAVVYRQSDGTIALAQINPTPAKNPRVFVTDPTPAPVMLLEDAVERLNLGAEPFLFFVDPQTRWGNVLYRRYDGHYGLIERAATV